MTLQGNVVDLKLKGAKGGSVTLMGNSDDPNTTNEQLMEGWKSSFVKAITGDTKELQAAKSGGGGKAKKAAGPKKPAAIAADELSDDEDAAPAKAKAAAKPKSKPVEVRMHHTRLAHSLGKLVYMHGVCATRLTIPRGSICVRVAWACSTSLRWWF